jgi:hypothetical protein
MAMSDPVQPGNPYWFPYPGPEEGASDETPAYQAQVPAVRWRAAAVALLNLSGLGLGYVLTRRWLAFAAAWIATGILLLIALPASPKGVPVGAVVVYVVVLGIAAVHGAVRALRAPPPWPRRSWLIVVLAVALTAVPAGGVLLYNQARADAVQRMLLGRLKAADAIMATTPGQTFVDAEPNYGAALAAYRDLLDNHRTSRAGKQVPGRIAAFYQTVGASYAYGNFCEAIAPLTYLRTLPSTVGTADLGTLATWPDDRLATSLYQCAASELDSSGGAGEATSHFNLLMTTFPASPQSAKVPKVFAAKLGTIAAGINGADSCGTTTQLHALDSQIAALQSSDSAVRAALVNDHTAADQDVESGTFACGAAQYKKADFADAQTTMNTFITTYPQDPDKALAGKYVIAAQIAQMDPDAGKQPPTMASGGSVTVTMTNDSPHAIHVLYTGSATGSVDVGACASCSAYASDAEGRLNACSGSTDYPQTTISIPPGTIYIVHEGSTGSSSTSKVIAEQTSAGDDFRYCAFETSPFGTFPLTPLPIIPPPVVG